MVLMCGEVSQHSEKLHGKNKCLGTRPLVSISQAIMESLQVASLLELTRKSQALAWTLKKKRGERKKVNMYFQLDSLDLFTLRSTAPDRGHYIVSSRYKYLLNEFHINEVF